jgi:glutathione S-transferase
MTTEERAAKGQVVPPRFLPAADVLAGETRRAAHLARNPLGTTPVLELESGACIGDVFAICE